MALGWLSVGLAGQLAGDRLRVPFDGALDHVVSEASTEGEELDGRQASGSGNVRHCMSNHCGWGSL